MTTCPSCKTSTDVSVIDYGDGHRKGVCDHCLYEWRLSFEGTLAHPSELGIVYGPEVGDPRNRAEGGVSDGA